MKNVTIVLMSLLIISLLVTTACSKDTQKNYGTITVNVCQTDPSNADYWSTTSINLFNKPGGIAAGATMINSMPACDSINAQVVDITSVSGQEFYRIKYGNIEGWQTKELLTGQ